MRLTFSQMCGVRWYLRSLFLASFRGMVLWFCTFWSLLYFMGPFRRVALGPVFKIFRNGGARSSKEDLRRVAEVLQELEDGLVGGSVPSAEFWLRVQGMAEPWGSLAHESFKELRSCGGALLPTLRRLRALSEDQSVILDQISSRMAQAYLQACVCFTLVPVLGLALFRILPGVSAHWESWVLGCFLAIGISGVGMVWLMRQGGAACWGGIRATRRSWVLAVHCAGERFLALVRVGNPPDLAWSKACDFLGRKEAELAGFWGYSIWEVDAEVQRRGFRDSEKNLVETGHSIKRAVQVSLMEGRPCVDRVENLLNAARRDFKAVLDRQVAELGTHSLKPLFICIAPALLGLLAFGLWLAFTYEMG